MRARSTGQGGQAFYLSQVAARRWVVERFFIMKENRDASILLADLAAGSCDSGRPRHTTTSVVGCTRAKVDEACQCRQEMVQVRHFQRVRDTPRRLRRRLSSS